MAAATSIDLTLGPMLTGVLLATFLFGVECVQLYMYFRDFPKDSQLLKGLVTIVWVVELTHQGCTMHSVYWLLISNFGNPHLTTSPVPATFVLPILFSAIIVLLVQTFFAHRLWRSTNKTILCIIFMILVVARFILTGVIAGSAINMQSFASFLKQFKALITAAWVSGACIDILMSLSLCYDLHTRRSGFVRTSRLIDRLIVWCVATGLLTSVYALIIAICFLTMPDNLIWDAMYIAASRFFANTLLASLNARRSIRRMDSQSTTNAISSSQFIDIGARTHNTLDVPLTVVVTETKTKDLENGLQRGMHKHARS
ncbi:hypothetical protein LshimejAT787_0904580 [Lyophyllum shimeji]|uniref:DUF6534 domain-containing protein n=1 Tax=Lyophyllum shimeji TaxID=47721 RepID=A0A9P3UQ21_LYOSH|nr:hypothetical protein LshimejAT787_0904580 [Lyophyllum shimeji]